MQEKKKKNLICMANDNSFNNWKKYVWAKYKTLKDRDAEIFDWISSVSFVKAFKCSVEWTIRMQHVEEKSERNSRATPTGKSQLSLQNNNRCFTALETNKAFASILHVIYKATHRDTHKCLFSPLLHLTLWLKTDALIFFRCALTVS